MPVERFQSNAAARQALRQRGFRQITYVTNQDPEYWWRDDTREAAEVARAQIYTYPRQTNAYQEIVSRLRIVVHHRGRVSDEDRSSV